MVSTLLIILSILLYSRTVSCTVDKEKELTLETWACLCWEFHNLGLDLFSDFAVVKGLEGDGLLEYLGGLETGGIYL